MELRKFSSLLLSVLVNVVDCAIDQQPVDVTLVSGLSGALQCSFTQEERARWEGTTNSGTSVPLFVGTVGGSDINRGTSAGPGTKYENFYIDSPLGSLKFNLNITNVEFMNDEGIYTCRPDLDAGVPATISIEVPTDYINISCGSCSGAAEPTCECTCIAEGGYPESLSLQWNVSPGNIVSQQDDPREGPDSNNKYDFRSTANVSISADNAGLSCSVQGYVNQAIIETTFPGVKTEQVLSSPECELTLTESQSDVCTVKLACSCHGYPSVHACTFYTRNGTQDAVIPDTLDSCVINYSLLPENEVTFLCLGSNGIDFVQNLSNEETSSCPKTTTPSTTEAVRTTPAPGPNIGLIVGLSVFGVIVLVAVVVLVYCFCVRDQTSSKSSQNDNTDGNGVNAKLAASQPEPTEPAEYASVNKPKSQPQAAPRSSAPPEKMELQYADLDHGNRGQSNEVRQPTNEPTEYATVQSVIV